MFGKKYKTGLPALAEFHLGQVTAATEPQQRREFGYSVFGPILADMLWRLHAHLHASPDPRTQVVFFCSRGGLVLRRMLNLFARNVGLEISVRCEDFMVSRLTAFRTALQLDPAAVAPLIEIEFAGRTCADAAGAIANLSAEGDARWNAPFSVAHLSELMGSTELGLRMRVINDRQAGLLRRNIDALRGANRRVVLCDTGVFGSILRYLQVGVPQVDWRSALLFRANYKHIPAPHFESTTGVVSEANAYHPLKPVTAALRYWQLIEAILEPDVPSVRYYQDDTSGRAESNLELSEWQGQLQPAPGSVLSGARGYLRELTAASIPSIEPRAQSAWRELRRRIVFPTMKDVELLAVGQRNLDFGVDESAEFSSRLDKRAGSLREKFSAARASMWPEGELRKQFPQVAGLILFGFELSRWMRSLTASDS